MVKRKDEKTYLKEVGIRHIEVPIWNPTPKTIEWLDIAMKHLRSVNYKPSGRWLFYRLLQEGIFTSKDGYNDKFHPSFGKARRQFLNGWTPDSVTDETTEIKMYGWGAMDESEVTVDKAIVLDKFKGQDYFIIICYEARAMTKQFEYYTRGIPLVPFGGQMHIPHKWDIAKLLEDAKEKYDLPIKILYYGDLDVYGEQIPETAFTDIRRWCTVDFDLEIVGLTKEQAIECKLPENNEKPGQFQWESLPDLDAKRIIQDSVNKYQNQDILNKTIEREKELIEIIREKIHGGKE